jgi:hypothetical protein
MCVYVRMGFVIVCVCVCVCVWVCGYENGFCNMCVCGFMNGFVMCVCVYVVL